MSDCKSRCGYDFKSAKHFSTERLPLNFHPEAFSSSGENDTVGVNHPDYGKLSACWRLMRDAVAGQEAVKENAFENGYIALPAGLKDERGKCLSEGQDYIERGRFPEVPLRHLQEVEGQLFNEDIKIELPDELLNIADSLDSQALSLEGFARVVMQEYFKIFRYGVYIQWNEKEARPEFVRYNAESIVNHKLGADGFPKLIVIEESYQDDDNIYSHEVNHRRIQLSIEGGRFTYREFILEDNEWVEDTEAAVVPTRNGQPLERIPFVMFGSWKNVSPPLKPIVNTTIDYFRAHVEWSHGLFYSAHPTLFANIGEGGSILSADIGADGEPLPYDMDIGAAKAHVFMNGSLAYAEVSGAALGALKERVLETRDELAGLGARSFINYSASNVAALTESLQQSGERGVLATFSRDISQKLTECLMWAAEWMGLSIDDIEYALDQSQNDDEFDPKCLPILYEGIDRGLWSAKRVIEYTRQNMPSLIPVDDEELAQEIANEGSGFDITEI